MKSSIKRTLKSRQVGLVQTYHTINGTDTTPADSGLDQAYTESVDDNGAGDYTINFIEPARRDVEVVGLVSLTPGAILSVAAVSASSVTVVAEDAAGTPMDADFAISLNHSKLIDAIF